MAFRFPVVGLEPPLDEENDRLGVCVFCLDVDTALLDSPDALEVIAPGSGNGGRPLSMEKYICFSTHFRRNESEQQ